MTEQFEFWEHSLKGDEMPQKEELNLDVRRQIRIRGIEDSDHDMDMEHMNQNAGCGELPSCAPLANPYVPYQMPNPPTYPAKNGIVRGTMFPGLDLPFMGMVNTKPLPESALHELQSLCFAVVELGEYLDTHQDDMEAFDLFRKYSVLYKKAKEAYEAENGPLTLEESGKFSKYAWMHDPWPWDCQPERED